MRLRSLSSRLAPSANLALPTWVPLPEFVSVSTKSLVRARLNLRVVPRQARLRQRHVVRIQAPDRRSSFVERKLLAVLQLALSIDDRQVREHLRSAAGFVAPDVQTSKSSASTIICVSSIFENEEEASFPLDYCF